MADPDTDLIIDDPGQFSTFIGDKARKAIFGLQKKLNCIKALPTEIRFDIFDTMIRPIITYTSDVLGLN